MNPNSDDFAPNSINPYPEMFTSVHLRTAYTLNYAFERLKKQYFWWHNSWLALVNQVPIL
jgi:hypothetical protein